MLRGLSRAAWAAETTRGRGRRIAAMPSQPYTYPWTKSLFDEHHYPEIGGEEIREGEKAIVVSVYAKLLSLCVSTRFWSAHLVTRLNNCITATGHARGQIRYFMEIRFAFSR